MVWKIAKPKAVARGHMVIPANVHHDWLKAGTGDGYGELMEEWVAFLGKIDFPYVSNCMRTVVGTQKTICVDMADSMTRYTSDETWDDLIRGERKVARWD